MPILNLQYVYGADGLEKVVIMMLIMYNRPGINGLPPFFSKNNKSIHLTQSES